MPCKVEYSCRKTVVGPLVYHNLLINDAKWHYAENTGTGPGMTKERVIEMAKQTNCREQDLNLRQFVKGWMVEC